MAISVRSDKSSTNLVKNTILEEDEYALKSYEEAVKEYKNNPKTYTLDEVKKELGI